MLRLGQILWKRLYNQLLRANRFAVLEASLIGLTSALAAVFLKQGVAWLSEGRLYLASEWPAWFVLPSLGLMGGLLAGLLVEQFAPEASGSGIPQVKAVLARVPMALDLRVAIVKMLSALLILGAGMPLGRQGPTVQIGSALAATLSRRFPTSPDHRRQLIAAGAGAGLAAAFNAPIAGVLFVVEELLQDVSNLTLGTAILASFIGATVSRWLGGRSLDIQPNTLNISFSPQDIPFYVVLGIAAGVLGALFNQGVLSSLTLNRRLNLSLPLRVGLCGLIAGLAIAVLPLPFRESEGLQELLIAGSHSWQFPLLAFIVQGVLTLIACSSEAPGGLFAPSLILGAALGSLVSGLEQIVLGVAPSATFALAGMGIFFSAVTRVPITSIVIVFEMTMDFNLVLPLMMGSGISYVVAETLSPGSLYDRLLEWKGIHLEKDPTAEGVWASLKAADIMKTRVETLPSRISINEAIQAFSQSSHRTFPIMEAGKLVGILTQSDLASIAQRRLGGETELREIMTPEPITVTPTQTLTHVLYLLNHYSLNCLPVTEGRRLVGVITRSDIIRAEAASLTGGIERLVPKPDPSFLVYQSRMPEIGQGRLLVPLSNPQTADALLRFAATMAQNKNYELECLQIILVPRHRKPSESPVDLGVSRQISDHAIELGRSLNISVHTQVRAAHDVAQAILDTIKERHIDLTLMGWKGSTSSPGRIFGDTVDTLIRQAACDVVLIKLGQGLGAKLQTGDALTSQSSFQTLMRLMQLKRWLIPVAGGPNAQHALQLLPNLVSLSREPEIKLCQVFHPSKTVHDADVLEQDATFLRERFPRSVMTTSMCADSVSEAIIDLAQKDRCDVIVLGASREGFLQQAIQGNLPEAIARNCKCTVILVRKALA
jgi:chloride channel protein, CIC family